eukprot:m.17889 g.17889  ORF g.17889 m.17889 type:complete len:270 (+) comp11716_c1_seq1:239-1048(+)
MESSRVNKTPKKPAVIALSPSVELVFNVPEGLAEDKQQPITATLTITNPTLDALCFKVKTTAPKDYCVRPNSGSLQSRDKVEINVMLQPPHPAGGISKDKFLVQTIYVGDVEDPSSPDMWKSVNKSLIMESRLKCRWNMTDAGVAGGAGGPQANSVKSVGPPSFVKTALSPSPSTVSPPNNDHVVSTDTKPTKVEEKSKQSEDNAKTAPKAVRTTTAPTTTSTTTSSSRKTSVTAVATKPSATNPEQVPSILLLLAVFLLGYIFGKFVL